MQTLRTLVHTQKYRGAITLLCSRGFVKITSKLHHFNAIMPQGQIKTLKNGFGYILDSTTQQELFFHVSALQNTEFKALKIGEIVEYELETQTSNLIARVRKIN